MRGELWRIKELEFDPQKGDVYFRQYPHELTVDVQVLADSWSVLVSAVMRSGRISLRSMIRLRAGVSRW